ncbi:hypothetical protein MERGE_002689 [Pneumocystis wakefieldiae]|uniref:Ergosterol biosynthetic protein 28 n=1 Tax=Pneumocystis wakefieldiae TaxID=38082 RepID=A0A899G1M5_9ASCO|nr:hypothetical protein MERGE_002689 [Pneumocystis wakefieldiae]
MLNRLPEGFLPKWNLIISILAFFNTIQTYISLKLTKRVYSGAHDQVNPLATRLFGTWTLISAIIRFYGAYHMSNSVIYEIILWTYYIAIFHFITEWFIFKSVKFGAPLAGPLIISTLSIIWMNVFRQNYLHY